MLTNLSILNYALIEKLYIDFSKGLTIITGETGAGKSILVEALSLVLGERADSHVLQDKNKKCIVEGTFNISNYHLKDFFKSNDLDYEDLTIIRRELNPAGKSRAFINDTPVNLGHLKELGLKLIDIHSQHQALTLHSAGFQLSVVDAYSRHPGLLNEYKIKYSEFKALENELNNLLEREKSSKSDKDYYKFQHDELEEANLQAGEQEALETEIETLNHAEEIKANLSKASYALNSDENSILNNLTEVKNLVSELIKYNPGLEELTERLKSSYIEIKDIVTEIENIQEKTSHNPKRIEDINTRLDLIYGLQQKHNLQTIGELLQLKESLKNKLDSIGSLEDEIKELRNRSAKLYENLATLAEKISKNRTKVIPFIEKDIKSLLNQMAMPSAGLKIEHAYIEERFPKSSGFRKSEFNSDGIDKIRFMFKANKGNDYNEISKVASGGELSRLMLSIKSSISQLTSLPAVIFDEIDKGISGEIADKVGNIMKNMSASMQVIAITHLPQIACKADSHYLAYKQSDAASTRSNLKKLTQNERINEIAKLLSGEELTTAAMDNARELLKIK
ncbi:MAG: DNA repair protein RecN [Bacteroidota bacterium]